MGNIALIACCKSKVETDRWVSAWKLYTGQLFRAQFDYARFVLKLPLTDIFILSAGLGLVRSDFQVQTYDITLNKMNGSARAEWADKVWVPLQSALAVKKPVIVYMMAGKLYREKLIERIQEHTDCTIPVPTGYGYGRQVQWYKQQLEGVK